MLNKLAIVTTLLIATASSVSAMPIRTVYENDANSSAIELKVWKGYGLTITALPAIMQYSFYPYPSPIIAFSF